MIERRSLSWNYQLLDLSCRSIPMMSEIRLTSNGEYAPIEFKVDTGAVSTSIPSRHFGLKSDADILRVFPYAKPELHCGIDSTSKIMYYRVVANSIKITRDRYELVGLPIAITADPRVKIALFGMSAMRLFHVDIDTEFSKITLTENYELAILRENKVPIFRSNDFFSKFEFSLDDLAAEANYINNLAKLDNP